MSKLGMKFTETLNPGTIGRLNEAIRDGAGPTECRDILADAGLPEASLPSLPTLSRYSATIRGLTQGEDHRDSDVPEFEKLGRLDLDNPRQALDKLIRALAGQADHLGALLLKRKDPRHQKLHADCLLALKSLLEARAKQEKREEETRGLLEIVESQMSYVLIDLFMGAYEELHGTEKKGEFVKLMKQKMESIDYDRLETEIEKIAMAGPERNSELAA